MLTVFCPSGFGVISSYLIIHPTFQVVLGLLKYWPKTSSQKEVNAAKKCILFVLPQMLIF